ncbi:MAG: methionyl-tRNA formyltransferase [Clostridiales bacterium]|jgi:methionyl-tRNA formyltransferase|nr:methionyl-tRNA formyltransferase [Clostridiales bacterium]
MRILFMGTSEFAIVCLQSLLNYDYDVCAVVTQSDKPCDRGQKSKASPVKKYAVEHNLEVYQPESLKNKIFSSKLFLLKPDIIVVVAYGKILPEYILNFPKYGCINVHASLLPKYRGAAPIQWSIMNDEKETGVTIMQMDEGLDTGDIISQVKIKIDENETFGKLHSRLSVVGSDLLVETLKQIESKKIDKVKQNNLYATYAPLINKETSKILWRNTSKEIINLIRSMNPYPGAWTVYKGRPVKFFKAQVKKNLEKFFLELDIFQKEYVPGQIINFKDDSIHVFVGNNEIVSIKEIQFPGKNKMKVKDYLNGNKIEINEIFT